MTTLILSGGLPQALDVIKDAVESLEKECETLREELARERRAREDEVHAAHASRDKAIGRLHELLRTLESCSSISDTARKLAHFKQHKLDLI